MKREAENEVMGLQSREHTGLPAALEDSEGGVEQILPQELPEGTNPTDALIWFFWSPKLREEMYVVLSHHIGSHLLEQRQENLFTEPGPFNLPTYIWQSLPRFPVLCLSRRFAAEPTVWLRLRFRSSSKSEACDGYLLLLL